MGVGGAAGGERQGVRALLLQVNIPGLVAVGERASGEEGLLGLSQVAPLRKDESGRDNHRDQVWSRGSLAHFIDILTSFATAQTSMCYN